MRFNEFKLTEAKTDDFYTVGDSHARGVGTTAGLDGARNLAVNGAAAHGRGVGREMLANIVKIPKGANVLISVGANDTADVVKQNLTSQGKIKLPPASKIVGDVMNVVNAVKAQEINRSRRSAVCWTIWNDWRSVKPRESWLLLTKPANGTTGPLERYQNQ